MTFKFSSEAHFSLLLIFLVPDQGQEVHGQVVRPGQLAALLPPSPDNQMNIETQEEGDRDTG